MCVMPDNLNVLCRSVSNKYITCPYCTGRNNSRNISLSNCVHYKCVCFIIFQDFYEIGIINPLKRVASSIENEGAANLAIRALQTIGEDIPPKLRQDVYSWSTNDVQTWLHLIGK